jgi:hypothetical protein
MKFRAGSAQKLPVLLCLRMWRITRKGKGNPCTAVDERRLSLAYQT